MIDPVHRRVGPSGSHVAQHRRMQRRVRAEVHALDASIEGMNFGADSPLHPPMLGDVASAWAYATVNGVDHPGAPNEEFASMTGNGKAFSVSMVPEPAEGTLLAAGAAMLFLLSARRRALASAVGPTPR